MKRILLFTFYFSLFTFNSNGQINIVPNPSFEQYNTCPTLQNPINYADDWFGGLVPPNTYGAGYFNQCANFSLINSGVPGNYLGYQQAHSGVAYALLIEGYLRTSPSDSVVSWHGYTRSYINVLLTKNIEVGHQYCVSYFVSLMDSSYYSSKNFGALFTTYPDTIHSSSEYPPLPIFANPQVVETNYISDKINWTSVQGVFTADSSYSYICIGNFSKDTTMQSLLGNSSSDWIKDASGYFIDDVSVIELPYQAAGTNTTICKGDSAQIGSLAESNFTYKWFPEAGLRLNDSTNANPYVNPTQTTTYYLTVQDSAGCSSTDSVTVSICEPQIPNVITPNGDGKNDYFLIENLPQNAELRIFNRWGNNVYNSLNYQNNWKADGVNAGTYYYILTLPNKDVKKGFIQVIK